jgi:hypothetical protein
MNSSLATGLWIGAAILTMLILLSLPLFVQRYNIQITPIYNVCTFLWHFWSQPGPTAYRMMVNLIESFCKTYKAFKRWLCRLYARRLRPASTTSPSSLLPLHAMSSYARQHSQITTCRGSRSFIDLPYDIRFITYRQYLLLFPGSKWTMTDTSKADPKFLRAMAFIRTCKLVREELATLIFRSLEFETDAKYPFYRNMPGSLTHEICYLSLHFRPSANLEFVHHTLVSQLRHMQALCKFTVVVPGGLLVDLDHEFEYILQRFKNAHPALKALTVMTRLSLTTPTDDLVLSQAMRRLMESLLPVFGGNSAVRTPVWTQDVGKGRFRPGTCWYCRIATRDES